MLRALIVALALASAAPAFAQSSVCPDNFGAFTGAQEPLACSCSAEAADTGTVFGTDVYTSESSICKAAVHAGVIGAAGGAVTVIPAPGLAAYPGVTRNGVASNNLGPSSSSFRFAGAASGAAPVAPSLTVPAPVTISAPTPAPRPAPGAACPENLEEVEGVADPFSCTCSAVAADTGSVFGMDVYMGYSSICRAAKHAGVVGISGGTVVVVPQPGRDTYPGVTRNGVPSTNYGPFGSSFSFGGSAGSAAAAPAASAATPPTVGSPAAVGGICPDNFEAFEGQTAPLPCGCSAEATQNGSVFGMDVYTANSSICRAALHFGVVNEKGGPVTVIPEAGRSAYPGVMRNGVTSNNLGPYGSSFKFAAATAPILIGNAPAQAPIAATIQDQGQVQLYINFKYDSAEIEPSATSTLTELRNALTQDPSLRLVLVGHTDSEGAPPYNLALSLRRAQSVMAWLTTQGIEPERLMVDGKGQTQPIADNAIESGRAVNRRVQAIRFP